MLSFCHSRENGNPVFPFCHSRVNGNPVFPFCHSHVNALILSFPWKRESSISIFLSFLVFCHSRVNGNPFFLFFVIYSFFLSFPTWLGIQSLPFVIPVQTGIQCFISNLDSYWSRNDSLNNFLRNFLKKFIIYQLVKHSVNKILKII